MSARLGLTTIISVFLLTQCGSGSGSSGPIADVGANQLPVAIDRDLSVVWNTPKSFELAGEDPDGDALIFSILSLPENGSLEGTPPNLTYTPNTDYTGADIFTFKVNDSFADSEVATIDIIVSPWAPPIGIPEPEFGILESHMMYAGQFYEAGGFDYRDAGNGPYTHYVDNSGECDDSNNGGYGSPEESLCRIPLGLPPGSVVEIHGGPYKYRNYYGSRLGITGTGTASKPIFVRGSSHDDKAVFTGTVAVRGSYMILENIRTDTIGDDEGLLGIWNPSDHLTVRHSEATNLPYAGGFRAVWNVVPKSVAAGGDPETAFNDHIVFYDNHIHDNGPFPPDIETGIHAITISGNSRRVWVVDNLFEYNAEDGFQIYYNSANSNYHARYIYVGRNVMHHNGENAVDIKQSQDVIVSQNVFHSYVPTHFPSSGSDGSAIVVNDDNASNGLNNRIWILFNEIYDSSNAIRAQAPTYIIGNVLHDIHHDPSDSSYNPNSLWSSGAGVLSWGADVVWVLDNTMYDVDAGISYPQGGTRELHVANNIIMDLAQPTHHVGIAVSTVAENSTLHHSILHDPGGSTQIKWGSSSTVYDLSTFQAAFPEQGIGCMDTDPLFVDPENSDFHLQSGSPAIDLGVDNEVYDTFFNLYGLDIRRDFDGAIRPQGSGWDIGAFEFIP